MTMTATLPIEPASPAADIYRHATFEGGAPAPQAAQFAAALDRAQAAQVAPGGGIEHYVRGDFAPALLVAGDGAMAQLGSLGSSMSQSFHSAINEIFAKASGIDFTDPASMVTVMEVNLGVFAAATQVQFASKVADFSVHGLTTLLRSQG